MTREQAIQGWIIPAIKNTWSEKNCQEIIKALEQEPTNKIVQKAYEDGKKDGYVQAKVEQEPKTGRWIPKLKRLWECSECGQIIYSETKSNLLEFHAFCGKCGVKMIIPQESEDEE